MEFPTPAEIVAKKLEDEEILEVLENRIPTSWKFQMDKESFDASSSIIKSLWKPVSAMKNANQKWLRKVVQLMKATPKEEGSARPNAKLAKKLTVTGTKNPMTSLQCLRTPLLQ
eukprot:15260975-Ditylum_brightwellii.AAC.1